MPPSHTTSGSPCIASGLVGVNVNQNGQVTGGVGVGASTEVGNSGVRAGVGVGTGTVIYDPNERR